MHKQQLINSFKKDFKMHQNWPIWDKNFWEEFNPLTRPLPQWEGDTPSARTTILTTLGASSPIEGGEVVT